VRVYNHTHRGAWQGDGLSSFFGLLCLSGSVIERGASVWASSEAQRRLMFTDAVIAAGRDGRFIAGRFSFFSRKTNRETLERHSLEALLK
jgi:hypothetical protein